MLKIEKFVHINALNKLLNRLKFSENLTSEEIDFFAGSSFIAEVFEMVHEEYIKQGLEVGLFKESDIDHTPISIDHFNIKAIENRIKQMDGSKKEAIKSMSYEKKEEYARILLSPLKYDEKVLNHITDCLRFPK